MRKVFHIGIFTFFVISLLIGIFHYKQLLYSSEGEIIDEKNITSVDTAGNSNDFYNKNIQKIDTIISQETKQEEINLENYQEITLEDNEIVPLEDSIVGQTKQQVEITFLGDVMIGSRVGDAMDKKGQDYVYGGLRDYLSQKDAVVLNLETSVTTREEKVNKAYSFKAKPEHLQGLKSFNQNLYANLANNHIGDYTASGVVDTMNYLDEYEIGYFGAGNNKSQADEIKIFNVEGVKIGLIGQTCVNPVSFGATQTIAGNSRFDKETILTEIHKAWENNVDIIVYNMHCGKEYSNGPNQMQIDYARFAIDSGADLVIGHHPHWYQPVEIYKDSFIFYSLGDTIFDIFRGRRTQVGIMANIIIEDKEIVAAEIIPTYTQSYGNTVISNERMKNYALNELYLISKKRGDIPEIKEGKIFLQK